MGEVDFPGGEPGVGAHKQFVGQGGGVGSLGGHDICHFFRVNGAYEEEGLFLFHCERFLFVCFRKPDEAHRQRGQADRKGDAAQRDVELRQGDGAPGDGDGVGVAVGEHGLAAFEGDDGEDEDGGEKDALEAEEDAVDAQACAAAAGAADDVAQHLGSVGHVGGVDVLTGCGFVAVGVVDEDFAVEVVAKVLFHDDGN